MTLASLALGSWGARWPGISRLPGTACFFTMSSPLPRNWLPPAVCKSAKQVAVVDVVIVMVPDTPHVEAVLFGQSGVAEGISKGKIVVDMSLISSRSPPRNLQRDQRPCADYLRCAGFRRCEVGAKAASLTIMVGGPEKAFNAMKPRC